MTTPSDTRRSASVRGLGSGLFGLSLGLALALTPGCKATHGEVCRCASDCRDGLVCVVGNNVLAANECGDATEIGHCADDDSLSDLEGGLGDIPIFDDLPTKRDIGGDEPMDTTGTDTTGTASTTDTSTDTSTDTGTDTSTDTSTETGTDTSTDTSTGSDSGSTT